MRAVACFFAILGPKLKELLMSDAWKATFTQCSKIRKYSKKTKKKLRSPVLNWISSLGPFCPSGPLHSKCFQKTADIGFEDFTSLWFCKHSQKGHRENDPKPFYATVGPLGFLLSSREAKTQ